MGKEADNLNWGIVNNHTKNEDALKDDKTQWFVQPSRRAYEQGPDKKVKPHNFGI